MSKQNEVDLAEAGKALDKLSQAKPEFTALVLGLVWQAYQEVVHTQEPLGSPTQYAQLFLDFLKQGGDDAAR